MSDPRKRGRPISQETKLGRAITKSGLRSYEVAGGAGFSPRLLTEYVSGRQFIPDHHLLALCRVLSLEPWQLKEDEQEEAEESTEEQLMDAARTVPMPKNLRTVEDLKRAHRTHYPLPVRKSATP